MKRGGGLLSRRQPLGCNKRASCKAEKEFCSLTTERVLTEEGEKRAGAEEMAEVVSIKTQRSSGSQHPPE